MLITIDTDLQAIIVPQNYNQLLNTWNDMVAGIGSRRMDSDQFLRMCFENALSTQVLSAEDYQKLCP